MSAHQVTAPEFGRPLPPTLGSFIGFGQPTFCQAMDFLTQEARLLDEDRLDDWLLLLAEDLRYTMPVRRSVLRGSDSVDPQMLHFDDDLATIKARVWRVVRSEYGYAENPTSRVRRFITNVQVHETDTADEFAVRSYELVQRSRWDATEYDVISCQRDDVLRRDQSADWGFKLARRIILIDQVTLGTPNLAIML